MDKISEYTQFCTQFCDLIAHYSSVFTTAHISPDDDAIGSMLAVREVVCSINSSVPVTMAISGKPEHRWKTFEHYNEILFVPDITNIIKKNDIIIFLDGGQYKRFTKNPDFFQNNNHKTIIIDHHASAPDPTTIAAIYPHVPANTQLIYDIFSPVISLSKPLTEAVLLGILGDTGNFSYIKPHQLDTLSVAQELLNYLQTEIQSFYLRYSALERTVYKAIARLMTHSQFHTIDEIPPFHTSFITRKELKELGLSYETVGSAKETFLASYIRSIKGYQWGFVCYPDEDGVVKVSLRSLPRVMNVRTIMEKMNIGGGHDYAAGGTLIKEGKILDGPDGISLMLEWLTKPKGRQ